MTTQSAYTSRWLAHVRPNPHASLRLFCFPYSGANAAIFATWADVLPAAVEVCPVQLPGRGMRLGEPPYTALDPLVEATAHALLPYCDKPFAFFGHSMGALVSFELARYLRAAHGLQPVHLLASGHSAPQLPDRDPPLHTLPEPEFEAKLRELNGTPPEVLEHTELRQLLFPILRADFAVCGTYSYRPDAPLDCSITALGGLQDPQVRRADLEAWREQTRATFVLRMFPGDHFFLQSARPLLLETIARELRPWFSAERSRA